MQLNITVEATDIEKVIVHDGWKPTESVTLYVSEGLMYLVSEDAAIKNDIHNSAIAIGQVELSEEEAGAIGIEHI